MSSKKPIFVARIVECRMFKQEKKGGRWRCFNMDKLGALAERYHFAFDLKHQEKDFEC